MEGGVRPLNWKAPLFSRPPKEPTTGAWEFLRLETRVGRSQQRPEARGGCAVGGSEPGSHPPGPPRPSRPTGFRWARPRPTPKADVWPHEAPATRSGLSRRS